MKCSANKNTCIEYHNGKCLSMGNCMHQADEEYIDKFNSIPRTSFVKETSDYVNSVVDAIKFLDEFSSYSPYQEAWGKVCSYYGIE